MVYQPTHVLCSVSCFESSGCIRCTLMQYLISFHLSQERFTATDLNHLCRLILTAQSCLCIIRLLPSPRGISINGSAGLRLFTFQQSVRIYFKRPEQLPLSLMYSSSFLKYSSFNFKNFSVLVYCSDSPKAILPKSCRKDPLLLSYPFLILYFVLLVDVIQ